MQRKGPKAPFALFILILIFGKKKPATEDESIPSLNARPEPFPMPDSLKKTITGNDVSKARDRLRLVNLERDIIGDALTKIYEAETKGQINDAEKNQLVQRYKTDLKRVDGEIDTHKKTVDLYELESAKEDLLKSFHEKMLEIDLKISQIRPRMTNTLEERVTQQESTSKAEANPTTPPRERPAKERPRNKAEERLETVREEVLKAMERLEQIETEG